jgi:hypothetical protein
VPHNRSALSDLLRALLTQQRYNPVSLTPVPERRAFCSVLARRDIAVDSMYLLGRSRPRINVAWACARGP